MDIIEKCELCKNNIYFPVNKYCCITCENIQHFLNKQLYKNLSKLKKNPKVKLKNELKVKLNKVKPKNELKPNKVKLNKVKPNKVKPNKVKPNKVKLKNELKPHRQTSLLPPIFNTDHCSVKIKLHTESIIIGVRE